PYVPWAAAVVDSIVIPQTGSLTFIAGASPHEDLDVRPPPPRNFFLTTRLRSGDGRRPLPVRRRETASIGIGKIAPPRRTRTLGAGPRGDRAVGPYPDERYRRACLGTPEGPGDRGLLSRGHALGDGRCLPRAPGVRFRRQPLGRDRGVVGRRRPEGPPVPLAYLRMWSALTSGEVRGCVR